MSLSLSQDGTFLVSATPSGPRLHLLDPVGKVNVPWPQIAAKVVRALLLTQPPLSAIVLENLPRSVAIYTSSLSLAVCDVQMQSTILDVYMNRQHLLVLTNDGVLSIYCVPEMTLLRKVRVGTNVQGKCALNDLSWWVVLVSSLAANTDLPGAVNLLEGSILVYDITRHAVLTVIKAHSLSVAILSVNHAYIASALHKGTLVRVFSVDKETGLMKYATTWRRGRNPAMIRQLAFSHDGSILACASRHTIHLFSTTNSDKVSKEYSSLTLHLQTFSRSLIRIEPRSFATVHVEESMHHNVPISVLATLLQVVIYPQVYKYTIQENNGDYEYIGTFTLL